MLLTEIKLKLKKMQFGRFGMVPTLYRLGKKDWTYKGCAFGFRNILIISQ